MARWLESEEGMASIGRFSPRRAFCRRGLARLHLSFLSQQPPERCVYLRRRRRLIQPSARRLGFSQLCHNFSFVTN